MLESFSLHRLKKAEFGALLFCIGNYVYRNKTYKYIYMSVPSFLTGVKKVDIMNHLCNSFCTYKIISLSCTSIIRISYSPFYSSSLSICNSQPLLITLYQ